MRSSDHLNVPNDQVFPSKDFYFICNDTDIFQVGIARISQVQIVKDCIREHETSSANSESRT